MKTIRAQMGTVLLALVALLSLVVGTLASANGPGFTVSWWAVVAAPCWAGERYTGAI